MSNESENMGCLFGLFSLLFGGPEHKKKSKAEPLEEIPEEAAGEQVAGDSQKSAGSKRQEYTDCYQKKYLLTKNEWYANKKLMELAQQRGLIVCPKVRLLDIIEPRKGEKDYKTLFYKVQAKHVDFVICDASMKILGVVELDDSSHDQKDRQSRDQFVDEILESVGYKVVHTRYINEKTLDPFGAPKAEE